MGWLPEPSTSSKLADIEEDWELLPSRDACRHVSRSDHKRRLASCGFLRLSIEQGEDHEWWECKWLWWWR